MIRGAGGFTVAELLIVITVIGILAAISVITPLSLLPAARDNERADDTASIARRLEQAYNEQTVGSPAAPSPQYPTTCGLMSDISTGSGTVALLSKDSLSAPGSSTSSVVVPATSSVCPAVATGSTTNPLLNKYVYQPLTSANALCDGTAGNTVCVRFFLYYTTEVGSNVVTLRSIHQQ